MLQRSTSDIIRLARLSDLTFTSSREDKSSLSAAVIRGQEVLISVADDLDRTAESARLVKEMEKVSRELAKVEKKLGNSQFLAKAPEEVVRKNRDLLEDLVAQKTKLKENLERLND
jgi:valyl-tRNA synthetase